MTVLETERLRLRPFELADAQALYEVVSAREVAAGTLTIPHPYEPEWAEEYIASIENETEFAITLGCRVYAFCFTRNPASRRVLEKLGMTHEGTRREHTLKWGEFLDSEAYAILREDWERGSADAR